MTVYIADEPNEYTPESQEDKIFYALKNNLPKDEDYYVFHSLRVTNVVNNVVIPKEIDFVVFNPKKGIICIEAKSGNVYTKLNEMNKLKWYYANGEIIDKGGPYWQAEKKQIAIINRFKKAKCSHLLDKCKIHFAVWFISLTKEQFNNITLTPEASEELTLTNEDLQNPGAALDKIFSLDVEKHINTELTKFDVKKVLENVLCPEFNLVASMASEISLKRSSLARLLAEQVKILDFLDEQQVVTINGAGGTGKTMIALEKAKRYANNEENVLFLCYNKALCEHLRNNYSQSNIDFYNIDAFACPYCKTGIADYKLLKNKITDDYLDGNFKYKHVIVDEGQDFGQSEIEENQILDTFEAAVVNEEDETGSMYVFYDKQQFIQGECCPSYIKNADCRLSLTVNCRNTNNIAETSIRPLNLPKKYRNIKIRPDSVIGDTTTLYASVDKDKQLEHLNLFIKKCISKSINPKEIVIISCKTKSEIENGNSLLSNYGSEYICDSVNIKITNCADFKGLEADAVILIDVDKGTFNTQKNCNRFYVAASRAKFNLYIICDMTQEDCAICSEIIQNKKENLPDNISLENIKLKNAEKRFAATLNATILS